MSLRPLSPRDYHLLVMRPQREHYLLKIAVQYLVEFMNGQSDAVVRDAVLRKIIRSDFFAAVPASHLSLPTLRDFRLLLFPFRFDDARAQGAHRFRAVFQLRPLILTTDDDSGRKMRNSHGRIGRIHA